VPPGPREEQPITAQGNPGTIFRRALKSGNLVAAELPIREAGPVTLAEALEFTALTAVRDRPRSLPLAVRWLRRWLDESSSPTLEDAAFVVACLSALGGQKHGHALAALRAHVPKGH
jgi:hypothetical protein